jgi:hypothetical protein
MFESAVKFVTHSVAACQAQGITFLPTWYKYLDSETVAGKCTPKIIFPDDLGKIGLAIVEIMLQLGAMIAVGFVIYGGFQYLMSQGESDRVANARKTILNAVIGLVICMLATGIVTFIAGQLI